MRNTITIIDKNVPKVTINSLKPGDMFRCSKSETNNVYMMCIPAWVGDITVVFLATGQRYSDFDREKNIEVVDAINISR